jgi:hypothetical protein
MFPVFETSMSFELTNVDASDYHGFFASALQ